MAFFGAGFAFASWASRIPQVKHRLGLDASDLGLVLLAISGGSVIALPLSGAVVTRLGSRFIVAATAMLEGLALIAVAFGYRVGVAPVVTGLFALGVATATWDVAMNVQGAIVERRLGRATMPRYHAGFSLGTVIGALGGTAMVAAHASVTAHLAVAGLVVASGVPMATRSFVSDHLDAGYVGDTARVRSARSSLAAWREPRTLLIGVVVLAFALAEGAGNDWIGVAMIDDRHARPAVATLALASFLAAMTAGRWLGTRLLDNHGRVPVIRATLLVAIGGLVGFVFGPDLPLAFAGALLWGAGISLGFPVGMSAGADDSRRAAARVSVISSIAYCGFLGGPPLIGFLAQRSTVLHALAAVIALLILSGMLAGSVRPLRSAN